MCIFVQFRPYYRFTIFVEIRKKSCLSLIYIVENILIVQIYQNFKFTTKIKKIFREAS